MIDANTAGPAVADNASACTLRPTDDCRRTINLPADQVERMTDRALADELALAVQDLVNALSRRRWCVDCTANNLGGGSRGGCPTCIAYLNGTRVVALAQAARRG